MIRWILKLFRRPEVKRDRWMVKRYADGEIALFLNGVLISPEQIIDMKRDGKLADMPFEFCYVASVLCVDGPRDGKTIEIEEPYFNVVFPVSINQAAMPHNDFVTSDLFPRYGKANYRRTKTTSGDILLYVDTVS